MITELRLKSQVTIPKVIVDKLGLAQGDQLEIREENGTIRITPVVVYPKKAVEAFGELARQAEADLKSGQLKEHKTVDELLQALKADQ